MEGEMKNKVKVWISILTSLCYCHFISSKITKGKLRLFSLLPIFFLFTILPLFLSDDFSRGLTLWFISWLCNFKLVLFAFDQGPLSLHPPKSSLLHFILLASLPIKNPYSNNPKISSPKFHLNCPTKALILPLLVSVQEYYKQVMPTFILSLMSSCVGYLLIDIIFGVSNAMVRAIFGLELESPSNEPYLATSLQDFWGRRWNLPVSNALRHTVYKPIRGYLENLLGSSLATAAALLAAFLVSGLMHELLYYYLTRANPTWEVTLFFVLHGVCVIVERRLLMGEWRWRLHWAVSVPLTVGFVVATAMWLFFPPLVRAGTTARTMEEFETLLNFVKGFVPQNFL